MDGPEGFDSSLSVWQSTGWAEVESLRKKLEDLPELRELVRQLGRSGGVGPLRRAPEEVRLGVSGCRAGVGSWNEPVWALIRPLGCIWHSRNLWRLAH